MIGVKLVEINFKDNKARDIAITIGDDDIKAYDSDHKIAEFHYWVTEEYVDNKYETTSIYELYSMNVDSAYQKSGIGTEIIKLGEEHYINVNYPHDTGDRNGNHLSNEGKALIDSCIHKGIISSKKYYGYDEEEDYDYGYGDE